MQSRGGQSRENWGGDGAEDSIEQPTPHSEVDRACPPGGGGVCQPQSCREGLSKGSPALPCSAPVPAAWVVGSHRAPVHRSRWERSRELIIK